ncbi:MAG: DMT family transporter [Acidobacteria bacterium]|nr:DMT family transporter [Acidobacteriota bacterium]
MHVSPRAVPRLQILATALLFSTGGAAIKATTLSSWQVAGFRSGVAALALVLMMPAARRAWSWRTVAIGTAYAATLIFFVRANKLTTAANTIFLQSTAPLYILLLAPLLLREPIRRRDVTFMAALAAGLGLLFVGVEPPVASAPDPMQGNFFAALSGVCYALTLTGLRWMGKQEERAAGSSLAALVSGNAIAFLVCLPWALPFTGGNTTDWIMVGYLGVFQIGLAYVLLTGAMRHVPALETSLLLLLEPVLNPVWAWLAHGEKPGAWSLFGGAIILLATTLKTVRSVRNCSS